MTVSIVIPAYRAEPTIGATISGALTQTHPDIEVVVVDDGSDDATADIVAAHRDQRVRLVRQPNGGVAAARNAGVAAARGEWIAFCDADDMLLPPHVASLVSLAAPRTIVTANAYWLFPGGISRSKLRHLGPFPAPHDQRRAILEQNFVSTMSLFPKELVDEIGPFDEALARAEDWDFWIRAIFAGYRIVQQPEPHALYRWTDGSLSADVQAMDRSVRDVIRRCAGRNDLRPDEDRYVRLRLRGAEPRKTFRDADRALRDGDFRRAARLYRDCAALITSDRRLAWKARLLSLSPRLAGPVLQRRQSGQDVSLGTGADQIR